jgi:hypothetical protein
MKKHNVPELERPRPTWPDMSKPLMGSRATPRPDPLWVRLGRRIRRLFASG